MSNKAISVYAEALKRREEEEKKSSGAQHFPTPKPIPLKEERPTVRVVERWADRPAERPKVRQGFDVFKDQMLSLGEIQLALYKLQGEKPTIGELVQAALDSYIKKMGRQLGFDRSPDRTTE